MLSRKFLFRARPYIPFFWVVGLVVCTWQESARSELPLWGGVLVLLGAALRFWSVGHVGRATRAMGSETVPLARAGPYRFARNPIYVGNFLIAAGFILWARLVWAIPIYVAIFCLMYGPIVAWEEEVLGRAYGADYAAYCAAVPRWIPRWSRPIGSATYPSQFRWSEAWRFERLIWLEILFISTALTLKIQREPVLRLAQELVARLGISGRGT